VSVKEQGAIVVDRLRRQQTMTFRALTRDSPDTLTTVARFLSLLELFREGAVSFDQMSPLGELTVRWTGAEDGDVEITDEFDGTPSEVVADVSAGTTDDDGETVVALADADQDADAADENHPDENEEKENP
jgi:segregation and condensation protein A